MKTTLQITLFLIAIFSFNLTFAQPTSFDGGLYGYHIPWQSGTPLSQMKTTAIKVDSNGNKWLGTQSKGLIKLTGNTWSNFYTVASGNLPNDSITCIETSGNFIFVGTRNGFAKFDGTTWTKYNQQNTNLPDKVIKCISFKNNRLWIGTNKGAALFNGISWNTFNSSVFPLINDTIQTIVQTANGDAWIGTINGLSKLSGSYWVSYDSTNSNLGSSNVLSLCVDINDSVWIGTNNNGLFKFTSLGFIHVSKYYPEYAYFPNNVSSIFKNQYGGITMSSNLLSFNLPKYYEFGADYKGYFVNDDIITMKYCDVNSNLIWITGSYSYDTLLFFIKNSETPTTISMNYLNINNIKAGFNNSGILFYDGLGISSFEVPKGSEKSTIFAANLWIAAKDSIDTLHLAGDKFYQEGRDWFSGPIMDSNYYVSEQDKWKNVWKINKSEIDFHNSHWWLSGYQIPNSILNWPGDGDTTKGQSKYLAPYYDLNGNKKYDPQHGDYPLIRGDQAILFIYNDAKYVHTATGGNKLGIEVHGMAYEFNRPNDSTLNNTLFINFRIFNKSQNNYDSLILGLFSDFDIGYSYDDYIGCDSNLNLAFGYNGHAFDGYGKISHYGANPPVMGSVLLNNPMNSFIAFNNNATIIGDPTTALEYYNYLQSKWKDGSHLMYGGNGYFSGGSTNIPSNYLYSGSWTEASVGNAPNDRRGLASCGPFVLPKDSSLCYDIAYIYARDTSITTSIDLLKQRTAQLQLFYNSNLSHDCHDFFTGVSEHLENTKFDISIFPNPTNSLITISRTSNEDAQITILDLSGKVIFVKQTNTNITELNLSTLPSGIYLIRIYSAKGVIIKKIVKD